MSRANPLYRKLFYLLPRVLLVMFVLASALLVVAGNFQIFEPILSPVFGFVQGTQRAVSEQITIGPYPHYEELKGLKRAGFDGVICLLNNKLPPERALRDLEKVSADRIGLEFYQFPLDYLNMEGPDNRAKLAEIDALVRRLSGKKLYVHCYLGRHRVELVRSYLIAHGTITQSPSGD